MAGEDPSEETRIAVVTEVRRSEWDVGVASSIGAGAVSVGGVGDSGGHQWCGNISGADCYRGRSWRSGGLSEVGATRVVDLPGYHTPRVLTKLPRTSPTQPGPTQPQPEPQQSDTMSLTFVPSVKMDPSVGKSGRPKVWGPRAAIQLQRQRQDVLESMVQRVAKPPPMHRSVSLDPGRGKQTLQEMWEEQHQRPLHQSASAEQLLGRAGW